MTESMERFLEKRHDLYRLRPKQPTTARCAYCGNTYPVSELGCIGYGVYICRGCA